MNRPTPGLGTPAPGLRSVHYDARSAAKVSLIVQPGDTLIVSDDVAAQLAASSAQFKTDAPPVTPAAPAPTEEPQATEEDTVSDQAVPGEEDTVSDQAVPGEEVAVQETPAATAKRATRKRAAKPKG